MIEDLEPCVFAAWGESNEGSQGDRGSCRKISGCDDRTNANCALQCSKVRYRIGVSNLRRGCVN